MSRFQYLTAILTIITLTITVSTRTIQFADAPLFDKIVTIANTPEGSDNSDKKNAIKNVEKNPINAVAKILQSETPSAKFQLRQKEIFFRLVEKRDREFNRIIQIYDNYRLKNVMPYTGTAYHNAAKDKYLFESRPYTSLDDHIRELSGRAHVNILSLVGYLGEMLWSLATFTGETGYSYCLASPRGFVVDDNGKVVLYDTSAASFRKYCYNSFMAIIPLEHMMAQSKYDGDFKGETARSKLDDIKLDYILRENDDASFETRYAARTDDDAFGAFVTFHIYFRHFLKGNPGAFEAAANNLLLGPGKNPTTMSADTKKAVLGLLSDALAKESTNKISGIEQLYTDYANFVETHNSNTKYRAFRQMLAGDLTELKEFAATNQQKIEFCNDVDVYSLFINEKVVEEMKKVAQAEAASPGSGKDKAALAVCDKKESVAAFCDKYKQQMPDCETMEKTTATYLEHILEQRTCETLKQVGFDCLSSIETVCKNYSQEYADAVKLYDFLIDNGKRDLTTAPMGDTVARENKKFCGERKNVVLMGWVNKMRKLNDEDAFKLKIEELAKSYSETAETSRKLAMALSIYETTVQVFIFNELKALFDISADAIDARSTKSNIESTGNKINFGYEKHVRSMIVKKFITNFVGLLIQQTARFSFVTKIRFLGKNLNVKSVVDDAPNKPQFYYTRRRSIEKSAVSVIGSLALLNFAEDSFSSVKPAADLKTESLLRELPAPCNLHVFANALGDNLTFKALLKTELKDSAAYADLLFADLVDRSDQVKETGYNNLENPIFARKAASLCGNVLYNLVRGPYFDGSKATSPKNAAELDKIAKDKTKLYAVINGLTEKEFLVSDRLVPYADKVSRYLETVAQAPFLGPQTGLSLKAVEKLPQLGRAVSTDSTKRTDGNLSTDDSHNNSLDSMNSSLLEIEDSDGISDTERLLI